MGSICCILCFNKSYHGLEIAEQISHDLSTMIRKISWGSSQFDNIFLKLDKKIKNSIALVIVEHIKKKKISVLNLNGFITSYISLNIAGLIFHKFVWDILYTPMKNFREVKEIPPEERTTFNYPSYEEIEQDYKDIFTNKAIDTYIKRFTENNYFEIFTREFKRTRNIEKYNINDRIGKEIITKNLEKYLEFVINQIISSSRDSTNILVDGPFNYSRYMNIMITKKNNYEAEVENAFYKISP